MRSEAQAVFFQGDGRVELRPVPLEAEGITITSRVIALSHGSERRVLQGELPDTSEGETIAALSDQTGYPVKYGYMNAGVGPDGGRYFAFYPHQNRFVCDPRDLIPIGEDLAFDDAVLLPSVETALSVTHDAHPRYGETVLVAGQGVIGLLVAELLLRSGARVMALEPIAARRERSVSLGCRTLDPSSTDCYDEILDATDGLGPDVAVNLSGSSEALQLLIDTAALESTVVEASWYGSRTSTLRLGTVFHRKKLTVRSSQVSRIPTVLSGRWSKERRFALALDLAGQLRPSKYITHRFPFQEASSAFDLLRSGEDEVLQIVLDPEED